MKKILLVSLMSMCLLAHAQQNENEFIFGLNSDFNIKWFSNDNLNNYLINNGYCTGSNILNSTSLGFSLRSLHNPFMIKVNYLFGESLNESSADKSVLYSNGFGFDFLYDLAKQETWFVGPSIGTKMQSYKLAAVSESSISMLTGKHLEEMIQINNSFLINIGAQFSRRIQINYLNLFLGLHGGYNINLSSNAWNNSIGQKLENIPNLKLSMINIGVNLRIEFNTDHLKVKNN